MAKGLEKIVHRPPNKASNAIQKILVNRMHQTRFVQNDQKYICSIPEKKISATVQ